MKGLSLFCFFPSSLPLLSLAFLSLESPGVMGIECCPFVLAALSTWLPRKLLVLSADVLLDRTLDPADTALTIALLGDLRVSHVALYATVCTLYFFFVCVCVSCFEIFLEGTVY